MPRPPTRLAPFRTTRLHPPYPFTPTVHPSVAPCPFPPHRVPVSSSSSSVPSSPLSCPPAITIHPPLPTTTTTLPHLRLQDVRGGASAGKSGKSGIVTKNSFDGTFTDTAGLSRKISWVGNRDYQIDGGAYSPSEPLTHPYIPLDPCTPCTPCTP